MAQISEFCGYKSIEKSYGVHLATTGIRNRRSGRSFQVVESFKRAPKKKQLVLLEDVDNIGKKGDLVTVSTGYWRNYLHPRRKAQAVTARILESIQAEEDAKLRAIAEVKLRAERVATALKTIGKFVIKKKSGDKESIFGSVTKQDVIDAVFQQTSQTLDKKDITMPEIKTLGAYDVSVQLHPEVVGTFKLVVAQEKNLPGKK